MGTPRKFGEFARAVRSLAQVPSVVAGKVAPKITRLMRSEMRSGRSPYGTPYAPLTPGSLDRGRVPPPLRRMAGSLSARPQRGSGIALLVGHPQAGFHQTGTSRMAKRLVLPDRAVPRSWQAAIDQAFKAAVSARMKGTA